MLGILVIFVFAAAWVAVNHVGKKRGWGTLKRHALGVLAAFVSITFIGAFLPQPPATPKATAAATAPTQKAPATPAVAAAAAPANVDPAPKPEQPTLGITVEQYVANFNAIAAQLKMKTHVAVPTIDSGIVNDVAQIRLDEGRFITLAVAKDTDKVLSMTFIGVPDGTTKSAINLMTGSLVALNAAFEESKRAEVGPAVGELFKAIKPEADSVKRTIADREVWMLLSSMTGLNAGVQLSDAGKVD